MPTSVDNVISSGRRLGGEGIPGSDDESRNLFLRACKDHFLPQLALRAYEEERALETFALVDRWRRTARPTCQTFVLRAQASFRIGRRQDAINDLLQALKIDPTHRTANLRLFEWGDARQRDRAARALLDFDESVLEGALSHLSQRGDVGAGRLRLRGQRLAGWCVWRPRAEVRLELCDASNAVTQVKVAPQAGHWLAGVFGVAADITSNFPFDAAAKASLLIEGKVVSQIGDRGDRFAEVETASSSDCDAHSVTIVVPVYDDAKATLRCLEALNPVLERSPDARVLVVDDASPDQTIRRFLREDFRGPRRRVITNARNLGYLISVNRALRMIPAGDVLLLNSDTVPLPSLVDDLRAIARSDVRIGTINPLSNNGEFVSFPKPFQNNAIDLDTLPALASCAAEANDGVAIDIPAGTGFCLYLTRACLQSVGPLSTDFKRGYLEDADFCLRARERGFRTVCAPGIFVTHIGSRSFRDEKQALVQRNNLTLERRFPVYFAESRSFVEADPLSPARARIEALFPPPRTRRLLIGPLFHVIAMRECAARLRHVGVDVLMVFIRPGRFGWSAKFEAHDGTMPQALTIEGESDGGPAVELERSLRKWTFDRVEIVAPFGLPESVVKLAQELEIPVDLVVSDAGLGAESPAAAWSELNKVVSHCEAPTNPEPCVNCRKKAGLDEKTKSRISAFLGQTRSMIFLDKLTRRPWTRSFSAKPRNLPTVLRKPVINERKGAPRSARGRYPGAQNVGILFPQETPSALRLVFILAELLSFRKANTFLFGATSVDERLIGRGVFVSGTIALSERETDLRQYPIARWVLPYRNGFLWRLEAFRASQTIPAAYFNPLPRLKPLSKFDLVIDPAVCDRKAAKIICDWFDLAVNIPSLAQGGMITEL